jgi:hypothetical protein
MVVIGYETYCFSHEDHVLRWQKNGKKTGASKTNYPVFDKSFISCGGINTFYDMLMNPFSHNRKSSVKFL